MTDPEAQVCYWHEHLGSPLLRLPLRAATHPWLLRRHYSAQVIRSIPTRFDREILARLVKGFGTYSNADNPFVRAYLLGDLSPVRFTGGDINLVTAGAAEYLESAPAGSFEGFTLSNIFDGAGEEYSARLVHATRKAGKTGAVSVVRRLAGSGGLDRSLIWGALEIDTDTNLSPAGVSAIGKAG